MTDYYVSTSGSNGNSGTVASPWKTIDYAVDNVTAGDTIYAAPGNYGAEHVTITKSGTAGNPITITRQGNSGMITLRHDVENTGKGIRVDGNYWTIEYFDVSNYNYNYYITEEYNIFNFCEAYGSSDYGFIVGLTGDYNVFNECVAHDIRNGFRLMGDYNLQKDCVVYGEIGHFGVSMGRSSSSGVCDGNVIDGGDYSGTISDTEIAINEVDSTVIKNVEVHNCRDGIRTYENSTNTEISNCYIHDISSRTGITMGGSGVVSNNVIHNWGPTLYGISADGGDIVFSKNDMQGPSKEYRFTKRDIGPNSGLPIPRSGENITIRNQVLNSFAIRTGTTSIAGNPKITVEYTDGRTFSVNGAGNYTSHTIDSLGTYSIVVTPKCPQKVEVLDKSSFVILGNVQVQATQNGVPMEHCTTSVSGGWCNMSLNQGETYKIELNPSGTFPPEYSYAGNSDVSQTITACTTTVRLLLTKDGAPTPTSTPWPTEGPPPPGIVGNWHFDEGEGTTAYDSSSSRNNGTIYGASWTTEGMLGSALSFDGVDDYVEAPHSASLDITDAITILVWINPISLGECNYPRIITKDDDPFEVDLAIGNRLDFELKDVNGATHIVLSATNSVPFNQWSHCAFVYDGATQRIYINGVQDPNISEWAGTIRTTLNDVYIGNKGDTERSFHGAIDEVKIYNGALTTEEILADYNAGLMPTPPPPDLVANWQLEEGSGTIAIDSSGYGNSGLIRGAAGYTTITEISEYALELDGVDDYIEVSNKPSLNTQSLTLMAWIKPLRSNTMNPTLFMRETSTGGNIFLVRAGINSDGSSRGVSCEWAPDWWEAVYDFEEGRWYHVVAVIDGPQRQVYVNGESLGEHTTTNEIDYSDPGRFFIGQDQDGSNTSDFFKGTIDEAKIYNYPLSADQILAEYEAGLPPTVPQMTRRECIDEILRVGGGQPIEYLHLPYGGIGEWGWGDGWLYYQESEEDAKTISIDSLDLYNPPTLDLDINFRIYGEGTFELDADWVKQQIQKLSFAAAPTPTPCPPVQVTFYTVPPNSMVWVDGEPL